MIVELTWDDGSKTTVETFQVDELVAEDAGFGGPDGVREEPDDTKDDGVRYVPINSDGSAFTSKQMIRYVRAAARAACIRTGVCDGPTFDRTCLAAEPGTDAPDPTVPVAADM